MINKSAQSIAEATNAKIHYHTGVFNWKNKVPMTVVGLAGVTLLAIGIITCLHGNGIMNAGALGSIPPGGAYAMIAVGTGLVLADVIALIVFGVRHHRQIGKLKADIEAETAPTVKWWKERYDSEDGELKEGQNRFVVKTINLSETEGVAQIVGKKRSIHIFLNQDLSTAYQNMLKKRGMKMISGAFLYSN